MSIRTFKRGCINVRSDAETDRAAHRDELLIFTRYYATLPNGERKKITVKLADKSETIRTRADVDHLIEKELAKANGPDTEASKWSVEDLVEKKYLPWVTATKPR
jgi:hypothetical protein